MIQSTSKLKFIFSFHGIVDLLAIIPSLIFLGTTDLLFLRSVRLFRLIRLFKLTRYSKAIMRLQNAFNEVKSELIIFTFLTFFILYISAAGIFFFENEAQPEVFKSIPHSLWWAVATLTTVGYGDAYPITIGGKIFTFFILLIGLNIISIPSALLASAFFKEGEKEKK